MAWSAITVITLSLLSLEKYEAERLVLQFVEALLLCGPIGLDL
jgi:hypothetical protein